MSRFLVAIHAQHQRDEHDHDRRGDPVDAEDRGRKVAAVGIRDHAHHERPDADAKERRHDDVEARGDAAHARQHLLEHDGVQRRVPRRQHQAVEHEARVERSRDRGVVDPDRDQRRDAERDQRHPGTARARKAHVDPVRQRSGDQRADHPERSGQQAELQARGRRRQAVVLHQERGREAHGAVVDHHLQRTDSRCTRATRASA